MTFVFEARELPFHTVTEAYASSIESLVRANNLTHLPLWDRCMLAAVLPVVQRRRAAVATAVAASLAGLPGGETRSRQNKGVTSSGGDVSNAAEERPRQITPPSHSLVNSLDKPNAPSAHSTTTSFPLDMGAATQSEVEVALSIVHQLDELEAVYDTVVTMRREQQEAADQVAASASSLSDPQYNHNNNADNPTTVAKKRPKKTSEEIIMEQLLQERFGDTAPYLPESVESDNASGERASQADDVVDVAMCFTTKGESLGIGSSAVFGGHGYHP